jgi:hypothetical protein
VGRRRACSLCCPSTRPRHSDPSPRVPLRHLPCRPQAFRFIEDIKAGVPRTAYKGTVMVKHNKCRKFIVPSTPLDANNALPH